LLIAPPTGRISTACIRRKRSCNLIRQDYSFIVWSIRGKSVDREPCAARVKEMNESLFL
jgi:hypothetical protein